jgi:hypothetical protein
MAVFNELPENRLNADLEFLWRFPRDRQRRTSPPQGTPDIALLLWIADKRARLVANASKSMLRVKISRMRLGVVSRRRTLTGTGAHPLVSRFRSSHTLAAPSDANFGIKGTLATL